jgi:hypothetical protein
MRYSFFNNNQVKLRRLSKFRIPVPNRATKVIIPKKEYKKQENKELVNQGLLEYDWEVEEEVMSEYDTEEE